MTCDFTVVLDGDLAVGEALRDQLEDFALAGRQLVELLRERLARAVLGHAEAVSLIYIPASHIDRIGIDPATFLVFLLLRYAEPATAGARFLERTGETLLGIGIAYLYGLALPALGERAPAPRDCERALTARLTLGIRRA